MKQNIKQLNPDDYELESTIPYSTALQQTWYFKHKKENTIKCVTQSTTGQCKGSIHLIHVLRARGVLGHGYKPKETLIKKDYESTQRAQTGEVFKGYGKHIPNDS